jgi:CBS domain-containing protein
VKLGDILAKQGHLDEAGLARALGLQQALPGRKLGAILVETGLVSELLLQRALNFQRALEADRLENKDEFLKDTAPFDTLGPGDIHEVANTMEWYHARAGDLIVEKGKRGERFYLIKSGLVKVYLDEDDKEKLLGFMGEGECFGEMSLLNEEPTSAYVRAVETTLCLTQEGQQFQDMVRGHPHFYKFFSQLFTRRMKQIHKELLTETPGIGEIEPFLYRKEVKEMVPLRVEFCTEQSTILEAAGKMLENRDQMIVVVDERTIPKGVVEIERILSSVLVGGKSPGAAVADIMEKDFRSIETTSFFFDALHEMVKHKTARLVVTHQGKAVGVVSSLDLLRFRGREVLSLLKNLEAASSIDEVNSLRGEVKEVLKALLSDGALASQACKIVSELNDKMVRRVIRLTEKEIGGPPCAYAWLGLGSEGRKEQTLLTDQDNAIIFSDSAGKEGVRYFNLFSSKVVKALADCGFALCKGNVMATNQRYFGNMEEWKKRTEEWVSKEAYLRDNLVDMYVFLDFRANSGDQDMATMLRNHLTHLVAENPSFLKTLASYIVDIPVPLGFFKNFVVEKSGSYKDRLNLKNYGLVPLVTCVKLLAWKFGVGDTNTLERVRGLTKHGAFSEDTAEVLEQAFETFLTLRMRNNIQDLEQGIEPSNYINPVFLSTKQKHLLKDAFLSVSELQKITKDALRAEGESFIG